GGAGARVDALTGPGQRGAGPRLAGQYPARRALYASGALDGVLPIPAADAARIIEHATPRPVTPLYAELSAALQVELHRALTGQAEPRAALAAAAAEMRRILAAAEARPERPGGRVAAIVLLGLGAAGL